MPLSDDLRDSLRRLYRELGVGACWPQEYVIFGSASLAIRGILEREPGDIDMFVSKRLWGRLLPRDGWFTETPKAGDPPILTLNTPIPVHAFYDWSDPWVGMDVERLLKTGERFKAKELNSAWQLVPIEEARRAKAHAIANVDNAKAEIHKQDIRLIDEVSVR
jgi:hypothetical protein